MVQQTDSVLPLLETPLDATIENVTYPVLGSGFRLRFGVVPPQHEVKSIADGLASAASKGTGKVYTTIDDSIGDDVIFTITEEGKPPQYRVFSCHVYSKPHQPKENYPAVAVLRDPDCSDDQKVISEYELFFKLLKNPDQLQ